MCRRVLPVAVVCATALTTVASAGMMVTCEDNGAALVNHIVGGVPVASVTYNGPPMAAGYFTDGLSAGIGIDSGIVLTTGDAGFLNSSANTFDDIGRGLGMPGAEFLDRLVPGYYTNDAIILGFQFTVPAGGADVLFDYVFASDEYEESVGSTLYNDVFGAFLDGTGVADNIALIPGTNTPVAINTVNGATYPDLYTTNARSAGAPFPFEYDGFTNVFHAEALGLSEGTHTLTLAIADATDEIGDSGVFIKADSFLLRQAKPVVPAPGALLLGSLGVGLVGWMRRHRTL